MLRHTFLLIPLLLAAASSASALTLNLAEIGPRLRTSHPSLKAARMVVEEARARQLGAGRLSNPSVGLDTRNETYLSPGQVILSLDQSFPLTKRLRLEKQFTGQLVTAAELEVKDAERRLISEAQTLAVQILAIEQQRSLRQQQTALAAKLSEFVAGRAKAGELSALDAAQAQVDAQRLIVEARKLEGESRSLLGALKPMLNLDPDDTLSISGTLPDMGVPGKGANWMIRADYQLAEAKLIASQTDIGLAKANKWEDVRAGIFAGPEYQNATGFDRRTNGVIGFRFSIPLPFWNKNQGQVAEKTAAAERVRLEQAALGKQIRSDVENARKDMQTSYDLAHETRDKLLPLVIEQTGKLEKAYENGQADLLTVLRAREQRLQLEAAALDAVRDFHLARIRYETATGKHAPAIPPAATAPAKPAIRSSPRP
ncbi:TolC family protein [Brevifollis gellanilyticus]|uniref:Divalent cation transporter n=1 Tax=Brevifollis gellanilyticus TaxID=748831 RepID=A0A512MCK0_9BACT|nr:TolC family protein [Brevifollis gellanilyticus]GEP44442.1 divalent cation transporter [Brevifollis gellanilyticus]